MNTVCFIPGMEQGKPTISSLAYLLAIIVLAFLVLDDRDDLVSAMAKGALVGLATGTIYVLGREDGRRRLSSAINHARSEHEKEEAE